MQKFLITWNFLNIIHKNMLLFSNKYEVGGGGGWNWLSF